MYIILEDILSNFKKKVYALKDEKVEYVATHGDILILQGKKERFPVHKSKVEKI